LQERRLIGDVLREAADTLETGSTFRCYHTKGGDSVAELDILSPEFTREAEAAWDRARNQALARGVPVFYRNDRTGLEITEQPDGRRFEIRFIPGAPRGRNFEIIRELARTAA